MIWRAGLDMAHDRGFTVLACRPAEAEMRLSYSGLTDLCATSIRSGSRPSLHRSGER